MSATKVIESEEWRSHSHMVDYRAEWPGDMLVERTTWTASVPQQLIHIQGFDPIVTADFGYVWFRFWLSTEEQVIERYFDREGNSIGTSIPICMPLDRRSHTYMTTGLILTLWINQDGSRVTVLNEDEFDQAIAADLLTPVQSQHAENRIRELTTAIAQKRFPPALVRNFTISITNVDEPKNLSAPFIPH